MKRLAEDRDKPPVIGKRPNSFVVDPDALRWRRQQARWRFYGEIGTLRLIETKMKVLSQAWPNDRMVQKLTLEIAERSEELRVALLAYKDDWKEDPPHANF